MDPNDLTLNIDLGKICNDSGYFSLSLSIRGDGSGRMRMYLCEENKRSGHMISMNLEDYNELRRIIKKTDDVLRQMSSENKLRSLE